MSQKQTGLSITETIEALEKGKCVSHSSLCGYYVKYYPPINNNLGMIKMKLPGEKQIHPFAPTMSQLKASDWFIVEWE